LHICFLLFHFNLITILWIAKDLKNTGKEILDFEQGVTSDSEDGLQRFLLGEEEGIFDGAYRIE
jgi:hypothetical protein